MTPGRIDTDARLFDPARTTSQACPVPHCPAIRTAGQQGRLITCAHDLDPERRKRPNGCLNAHDNSTAPFPDGY